MAERRNRTKAAKVPPVGSRVRLRFGAADVVATVTEHRGPLGVGGRELIGVKFQFEHSADAIELEIAVEYVTPVAASA